MHLLKKDVALIPIIILPILETQQLRKRGEGIAAQVSNSFELLEFVRMARLCPIRDIDHGLREVRADWPVSDKPKFKPFQERIDREIWEQF